MNRKTTCSAIDWNEMLGLSDRLKSDRLYRDYLLILVGCHFGLRISDLLSIRWSDFDNSDEIVIQEGKTKKIRAIRLNARVRVAITYCRNKIELKSIDQPLFANRSGDVITVSYVNKRLKWIFFKYRIKTQNASSHTLRKTFGMRVYQLHGETEKALIFLSEVFGHSNTAITRRYLGITQQEVSELYLDL